MKSMMKKPLVAALLGSTLFAMSTGMAASAELSMWVRASASTAAKQMVALWNSDHENKIKLAVFPDNQMVTKVATSVRVGDAPDLLSFDLIYMPQFMQAGFLTDLTSMLKSDPNYATVAQAYKDISTYEGKVYGTGFLPDVSVLVWNKDLFKQAGLDPNKGPQTVSDIVSMSKKISALGPDIHGFYFSGACPGCNIFTMAPMMVASGSKLLPKTPDAPALTGNGVKDVLTAYRTMWTDGAIPKSAQADSGADFMAQFDTGKIGMQGTGGLAISAMKADYPKINFGVTYLPGLKAGEKSGFVGGDVIAVPKSAKHPKLAEEFVKWQMTEKAQLEGLAKNNIVPSRTDLADNKYFKGDPRVVLTAKALAAGFTPWSLQFNAMVNSDSSPWINMIQSAVFDGQIDQAISSAQDEMKQIAAQ